MRVNTTIEELWLGGNQIGDEGATQLSHALRANFIIQELCLSNNWVGNEGERQLRNALKYTIGLKISTKYDPNNYPIWFVISILSLMFDIV